ncbi:MAG: hypothetical protein D6794_02410 [Deltaproteobacteria bacterium]|nr:MAG: hypothetical protein D6794_02410 [Deltaproteobacteria bacterium]
MGKNLWSSLETDGIYHIYNRSVGNEILFPQKRNFLFFLKRWKELLFGLDVFAWCLLPNHFHFLVRVRPPDDGIMRQVQRQQTIKSKAFIAGEISWAAFLESQFQRLFMSYALAINAQEGRHGSLFQKRFKRVPILSEPKCLYLLAYIHHNPIHHGYCRHFSQWPWSSWHAFHALDKPSAVNRKEVLSWFAPTTEEALQRFDEYHQAFKCERKMERWTIE